MNRIEFSATMIFDEKNFEKAKEIVKGQKVLGHNFNVTEDRKDGDMSPQIAVFDNIIKIYLPVSYMGKEGADIADNLLDLSYGYYMDKVFESNEYSRTAFYEGKSFYYDCLPEMHTSERLEHLIVSRDEKIKDLDASRFIKLMSSDYVELISSCDECDIENKLSEFFTQIEESKKSFSELDMENVLRAIEDESKLIGFFYKDSESVSDDFELLLGK